MHWEDVRRLQTQKRAVPIKVFPSRPLCRDFPWDCWRSNAALKLESSTTVFLRGEPGGLAASRRLISLTGLWLTVLFFAFPEEARRLLWPEALTEGALTGTYSTRSS